MTSEATLAVEPLGLGVVGLSRAFTLTLPSILADPRIRLAAAAEPRPEARVEFTRSFDAPAFESLADMLKEPSVEMVYVASPHQLHREHAVASLAAGRHVLIEKPIAISLEDSRAIIAAAERYRRHVVVGPSHSFDPQVNNALALVINGEFGRLRMIRASYYTDFLYRPRRPEELKTAEGGGVIFSQAAHHIDIIRLLAGGRTARVAALTGSWDAARPTEGAYMALLEFESGVIANLTYSGYAHYDSDEEAGWIGELGVRKDPADYGAARRRLAAISSPEEEAALKSARAFGAGARLPAPDGNEHFGDLMLSFDRADMRIGPHEIKIYGDREVAMRPVYPLAAGRATVMDAIWRAVREDRPAIQDARWGHATLEICHAMLTSAATGSWQQLKEQVAVPGYPADDRNGE